MIETRQSLRIAFVADTLNAPIGGGVLAGRHVVDRLRAMHDVVVVGADVDGPDDVRLPGFQLPLRAMRRMQFVMARPQRAMLAKVLADVDVVHLQFPFWLSFTALDEARKLGKPVVAAFHVQPENAFYNIGIRSERLSRTIYHFWIDRLYNRVDAVVCPTRFAERKLRGHGLRTPTVVISNGVPPDVRDIPRTREAWQRDHARPDHFLVLMVGRLAAEKRQDLLIEAVRRSKHAARIQLVIAGAGPQEEELLARASTLPNGAEIGFLPRERLRQLLGSADLFVHCSEVELEGIAVLEAMAAGLPALIAQSPESAASEFALDDDFRFPAGDVDALTAKLDALIESPVKLARAGERYRKWASDLSFEQNVERLVHVYRGVVPSAAPPTPHERAPSLAG